MPTQETGHSEREEGAVANEATLRKRDRDISMTTPLPLVHLRDPGRRDRLNRRQEGCIAAQSRSKSGPVLLVASSLPAR